MKAEIVGVGTELLLGQIANTNARTISEALAPAGVDVLFHTVVGDNEERIADALAAALARVDVVITTGGLGPTHDDLTREAIARVTGRPLERRPELEQWLRRRFGRLGRPMPEANLRQADVPAGGSSIPNLRGTAPGIVLEHEGRLIYALPGPPVEIEPMISSAVVPELRARTGATIVSRTLRIAEVPESEVAERIRDVIERLDREPTATIALLASAGDVTVRITVKAGSTEAARARIAPVEREVRAIMGTAVYGVDDDTLEGALSALLQERHATLAVAESLTGGLVCSRIVSVPGASSLLLAAYVAYSTEAKERDLGVPREVIERNGTVSAETAAAMADGARRRAGADLGLSTTGEAGPDPSEAPVGTVFIGLAWDGGTSVRPLRLGGGRDLIRRWATQSALNALRTHLVEPGG
ncbi:MAG: competence/damage-inducible protein A [Actinomycetota bacterium]